MKKSLPFLACISLFLPSTIHAATQSTQGYYDTLIQCYWSSAYRTRDVVQDEYKTSTQQPQAMPQQESNKRLPKDVKNIVLDYLGVDYTQLQLVEKIEVGKTVYDLILNREGTRLFGSKSGSQVCAWHIPNIADKPVNFIGKKHPNGDLLLSYAFKAPVLFSYNENLLLAWQTNNRKPSAIVKRQTKDQIKSIKLSKDGKYLFCAGRQKENNSYIIEVWSVKKLDLVTTLAGHDEAIRCLAVSPDGQRLFSGSNDQQIGVWDIGKLKKKGNKPIALLKAHTGQVFKLLVSPDGRRLVSASEAKEIYLWNIENTQQPVFIRSLLNKLVHKLVITPNGILFCTPSNVGCKTATNVALKGETIQAINIYNEYAKTALKKCHTDMIRCLLLSPDGDTLFSAGDDGAIRLWDTKSCNLLSVLTTHKKPVVSLALNPAGTVLFAGSEDKTLSMFAIK